MHHTFIILLHFWYCELAKTDYVDGYQSSEKIPEMVAIGYTSVVTIQNADELLEIVQPLNKVTIVTLMDLHKQLQRKQGILYRCCMHGC